MAGLSAGEVFVNLVVKGEGVKPALSKASAAVKEFGKGISAATVATGVIIADVAKSAFGAMASLGKGALDRAIISPKTSKGLQDLSRSLYMITENLKQWGVTIISMVLPYLNMLASAALSVVKSISEFIASMEQSAVVAGIQSGNIFKAFELMFTQIAAKALEFVGPLIAPFIGFAAMVIQTMQEIGSGIQVVFDYISGIFATFWDGMKSGFTQLSKVFEGFAGGVMVGWQIMVKSMLTMFVEVINKSGQMIKGLVMGLKVIAPQIASQLGPLESLADSLGAVTVPAFNAGVGNIENLFSGIETGFTQLWNRAGEMGDSVLQEQLDKMRERITSVSSELQKKQEEVVKSGEASMGFLTAQKGYTGTSAILASSGGGGMFQTQKDLLKEAKEQKEIAKKQLKEQEKIAKQRGVVFVQ